MSNPQRENAIKVLRELLKQHPHGETAEAIELAILALRALIEVNRIQRSAEE